MKEIKCPYDLNQFIIGEPIFENTFPKEECVKRKFHGDCFYCFGTAIERRDHQLADKKSKEWLSTFNTESATECFTAVQQLKEKIYD